MTEAPLERIESRRSAAPVRVARGMLSDESLARRVTAGEREAFGALYERYRGPLSRYCRSIVQDREEAADALQNAMLAALAGLEREAPSGPLRPWLYRIAHNESINLIRRRARSHEELVAETPELSDVAAPEEVTEQIRALFSDLGELPERQRGALVMRELAGLEYDQIGRAFATSAVAARKLVYEARVGLHAQREGRASSCEAVLRQLSDGDGRSARGRVLQAHLRGCDSCAAFERALRVRAEQFALIPAAGMLGGGVWLAGGLGGGASKALAGAGVAAGSSAAAGAGAGGALSGAVVSGAGSVMAAKCLVLCGALAVVGAGTTAIVTGHHRSNRHVTALSAAVAHPPLRSGDRPSSAITGHAAASATARSGTGVPTATGPAEAVRTRIAHAGGTAGARSAPRAGVVGRPTRTSAPAAATTSTTLAAASPTSTSSPAVSTPVSVSAPSAAPAGVSNSAEPTSADSSDPIASDASQWVAEAAASFSQAESAASQAESAASSASSAGSASQAASVSQAVSAAGSASATGGSATSQLASTLSAMFAAIGEGTSGPGQSSSN